MFCRYCGHSQPDDSIFCSKCGKAIAEVPTTGPASNSRPAPTVQPEANRQRPPAWPRVATGFQILAYNALAATLWGVFLLILVALPSPPSWADSETMVDIASVVLGLWMLLGLGYLQQTSKRRALLARFAGLLVLVSVFASLRSGHTAADVELLCSFAATFLIILYVSAFAKVAGERGLLRGARGLLVFAILSLILLFAAAGVNRANPKSTEGGILAIGALLTLVAVSVWEIALYFKVVGVLRNPKFQVIESSAAVREPPLRGRPTW